MSAITQRVAADSQLLGVGKPARKATQVGRRGAPDPRSVERIRRQIESELRSIRATEARLAAMILLADRERIGDEPIGEFLMRIQEIKRPTVAAWLLAAQVNPWRRSDHLTADQVRAIARQLIAFWKAETTS